MSDGYVQQVFLKFTEKFPNLKKSQNSLSGVQLNSSEGSYSGMVLGRKRKVIQMDGPRSPWKRIKPDEHLADLP